MAMRIGQPAARASLKDLAVSPSGKSAYAGHRMCSAVIHPGAALHRGTLMPRPRIGAMLDEVGYIMAAWADATLRALE
jgi:hypothetical protein